MKQKKESSPEELLRVEGIGAKGFGIIPRYAMCDPDLGWSGKVLYAYLCALAGSGSQTWPKKDTILSHLGIGNKTYYAAQKVLQANGYILIEQTRRGNRQGVNIYTLVASPAKIRSNALNVPSDDRMTSRVRASGLKAGGYGMLPRLVMIDDRLCAKTKLVYAYLASYAGAGCSAFPETATALQQLSLYKDAWRKAVRELTLCGYLKVEQRRVKGRFDVYDYILLERPDEKKKKKKRRSPVSKPETGFDTGEPKAPEAGFDTAELKAPEAGIDTAELMAPEAGFNTAELKAPEAGIDTAEPKAPEAGFNTAEPETPETGIDTAERFLPASVNDTAGTSPEAGLWEAGFDTPYLATVLSSNNKGNYIQSVYQHGTDDTASNNESVDRWMDYESAKTLLANRLGLSDIATAERLYGGDVQAAQELMNLLADTLSGEGKTFRLGKTEKPKEILWTLTPEHLRNVMESVKTQHQPIRNMRAYLLTALYNATQTYSAFALTQQRERQAVTVDARENQQEMAALLRRLRED